MKNHNYFQGLASQLSSFKAAGVKVMGDGSLAIGKIKNKRLWYLCHLFSGIDPVLIHASENDLEVSVPPEVIEFYSEVNGVSLFGPGQINIWSFPVASSPEEANYRGVSIVNGNFSYREYLGFQVEGALIIGEYFGSYIFYVLEGRVYCCDTEKFRTICSWGAIEEMINELATNLSVYFDANCEVNDNKVNEAPVALARYIK